MRGLQNGERMTLIQRPPAAARQTTKGHAAPRKGAAVRGKGPEPRGTLIVTIEQGSILDDKDTQAPDPRCEFTVRVTSTTPGASRPKKDEHAGPTAVTFALLPGTYRIDVTHDWDNHADCFPLLYPDGASIATIESGKKTEATVILANDTLAAVASAGKLHVGVQKNIAAARGNAALGSVLDSLETEEYNALLMGLEWYTFQGVQADPPTGPWLGPVGPLTVAGATGGLAAAYGAFPLSAPLVRHYLTNPVNGAIDLQSLAAGLALNGWNLNDPYTPSFSDIATKTHAKTQDYTLGCALYTNYGQLARWATPPWYSADPKAPAPATPTPPTYSVLNPDGTVQHDTGVSWADLMKDHVAATMGVVSCLAKPNNAYSTVAPPPLSWIVVNEVLDNSSLNDWSYWFGGGPHVQKRHARSEADTLRNQFMLRMFETARAVCPDTLLLEADFDIEFVDPPPPKRTNGKRDKPRGRQKTLPPKGKYGKADLIYGMMKYCWAKGGPLRSNLGVGYEMHFEWMPDYARDPAFWRSCLVRGLQRYAGLGMRVVVTEMTIAAYPPSLLSIPSTGTAPAPNSDGWLPPATYNTYRYQASNCTETRWRQQAFVYRDIVRTFYKQPNCDTLYFFCGYDEPIDEASDYFGHLFDLGSVVQDPYPTPPDPNKPLPPPPYHWVAPTPTKKPAYYGVLNGLIEAIDFKHPKKAPPHRVRGREPASGPVPNWLRGYYPS